MSVTLRAKLLGVSVAIAALAAGLHSSQVFAQGVTAGRMPGVAGVTSSGAASYTIPLWTPPGVGDVQLSLTLEYNSRGGEGLLGQGWTLAGLGEIRRCNRTLAQDGSYGAVTHTNVDRLCLNGQQLKLVSGAYHGANSIYATEIESFAKIQKMSDGRFVVTSKNGLVQEYGTSSNSTMVDGATGVPRLWALSRIRDRLSTPNRIDITYYNNAASAGTGNHGTYRVASITYPVTAAGQGPFYQVDFGYVARPANAQSISYLAGSKITESNLLATVATRQYASGTIIKSYNLAYNQNSITKRMQLASVTECSAANCLRPTTVSYNNGNSGWGAVVSSTSNATGGSSPVSADLNGDGRTDLLYPVKSNSNSTWWVAFATASGYAAGVTTNLTTANGLPMLVGQFAGLGKDQVLLQQSGTWRVLTYTGSSFTVADTGLAASNTGVGKETVADWDGDGLPDLFLVSSAGNTIHVHRNLTTPGSGVSFSTSPLMLASASLGVYSIGASAPYGQVDFNGDGRADLLTLLVLNPENFDFLDNWTWKIQLSNGFSNAATEVDLLTTPAGLMMDFNADGCTDFFGAGIAALAGNCAGGFEALPVPAMPIGYYGMGHMVVDENADGRADYLFINPSNQKWYVIHSLADNTFSVPVNTGLDAPSGTSWFPVDYNGDGLTDLAYRDTSTNSYRLRVRPHVATAAPADTAATITDGYGVTQTLTYKTIVQSNYTKGTGAVWPLVDMQGPLWVVSQATLNGGTSASFNVQYHYTGARVHVQGRGFAGFQTVRTYDSRTMFYTLNTLRQDLPYIGMPAQRVTYQSNLSTKVAETTATLANQTIGAGYEASYFPYVTATTDFKYELGGTLNGTLVAQTATNDTYGDGKGNLTARSVTVIDRATNSPFLNSSWTSSLSASYHNDLVNNCFGLPNTVSVTRTAPGQSAMTSTVTNNADTTYCRLTERVVEPNEAPLRTVTALGFDSCGNINSISITGSNWDGAALPVRTSTLDYGTRCQLPESAANALNETSTLAYNYEFGVPTSATDANGISTNWAVDDFGRPVLETRPDGTSTVRSFVSCSTASCLGVSTNARLQVTEQLRDSGQSVYNTLTRYHDGLGNLERRSHQLVTGTTVTERMAYDAFNRVITSYNPASVGNNNGYLALTRDVLGRVTAERLYNSSSTLDRTTTYGYAGGIVSITDPLSRVTTQVTDPLGQLRRVVDPAPGGTTYYDYDSFGSLMRIQDPGGVVSSGTNNVLGLRTQWSDAATGSWTYQFNSFGELVNWTDAKNQSFSALYDKLGRMTFRTELEGTSSWTWGSSAAARNIGRLSSKSGYGYSELLSYDGVGRPAMRTITTDQTYDYNFTYNSIGAMETVTYPTSSIPSGRFKAKYYYGYGQLTSIVDASSTTEQSLWTLGGVNDYGSPTMQTLGGVANVVSTFKSWTNELVGQTAGKVPSNTDRQRLAFTWDTVGNLTQRQDLNQSLTEVFSSDALNRVTGSTLNGTTNLSVGYNAAGNITSKSDVGAYSYSDSARPHAVTAAGTYAFTYDANGNQATRNGLSLTWASFNLPTALQQNVSGTTYTSTFNYGPDRQRWRQVASYSNGTEITHYVGGLFEKRHASSTGKTYRRHYIPTPAGNVVISWNDDGTHSTHFAVEDHLGSTTTVLSAAGDLITRHGFATFGARRGGNWAAATPPDWAGIASTTRDGFTGHEHLDNINLVHLNGRVYDPIVGRVISPDPIIASLADSQSVNPYAYVGNRPLNHTDPTGYAATGDDRGTLGLGIGVGSGNPVLVVAAIIFSNWGSKPSLPSPNSLPGVTAQGGPFGQGTGGACGSMSNNTCGGMVLTISGTTGSEDGSSLGRTLGADGLDDPYWAEKMLIEDLLRSALDELVLDTVNAALEAQKAARKGEYGQAAVLVVGFACELGKLCKGVGHVAELGIDHAKTVSKAARGTIHKNSLDYVGETHVYRVRGPDGSTYKIGESAQGVRASDGASIRAEQQARQLTRKTGDVYTTDIRRTYPGKASAREYETRVIERFRRMYGDDTLPGNRTNR